MTTYNKEIDLICKAGETVQLRVHKLLHTMASDWQKSGDVRPVVIGVNYFLSTAPKGFRITAVQKWVEKFYGFIWNSGTKAFVAGKTKGSDLDLTAIKNIRWWEFTKEPQFVPITDADKLIAQLLKKFEADRTELGDKSVVTVEQVEALRAIRKAA